MGVGGEHQVIPPEEQSEVWAGGCGVRVPALPRGGEWGRSLEGLDSSSPLGLS